MPLSITHFLFLSLATAHICVHAEQAHEHTGRLNPYRKAPDKIALSQKEQEKFLSGRAIYKKIDIDNKKRGLAIFKVNASPETIWSTIREFNSYPEWIKSVKKADMYSTDGENIYVRFEAKHWLLGKTTWYVHHNFPPLNTLKHKNWGSWTLDYQHRSDFDDSVGFWQVLPLPGQAQASKVIYSVDLQFKDKTLGFIKGLATKSALKQATIWVKQQSEKQHTLK